MNNISTLITYINLYRALYCAPPLKWDVPAYNFAQSWANQLARADVLKHSSSRKYGENLAMLSLRPNATYNETAFSMIAMDLWMAEEKFYNFSKPGFSSKTGHFTAMIWRNTGAFGIATALSKTGKLMVVLETTPVGNINTLSAFAANVRRCKRRLNKI